MKVLLANEFIPTAADTYHANFPDTIVLRDDIRKLTGKNILNKINMREGELDLLDGSPPCFEGSVLVMTSKDYKQIKDIKIGDYVLTHKNRFKKVLNTSKVKRAKILDIKIAGCHWFKATENHPFYVRKKIRKIFKEAEWKMLKDIDETYYIGTIKNEKPKISWVQFEEKKELTWNDYVYNLEIEEDNSYTVYNLIVHNCQGFSQAGKGSEKWGKVVKYSETYQRTDDLFYEYARILADIKPKVFVAENVYGMAIGESKVVFNAVLNELKSKGYNVRCRLLNAKYFNVAQNRPRLIWIGVREDLNIEPSHPKPQTKPTAIQDVLKDIKNEESELKASRYKETSSVYAYLLKMKPGESGSDYNEKGSYFGLLRLSWDKPANTILQSDAKHISCSAIHPDEHRRLTITELKRISSFPDDFILLGNYKQKWERIGRAVCPNMMKAIAEHVRYKILNKIYNIEEEYNPSFYNADEEEKGQNTFDFIRDYSNFREYK
jgi:DNA (cytosine-5)-methyltransferase 1